MLTREEAFREMSEDVRRACYVGDDVLACAQRFEGSDEFQAVLKLLEKHRISPEGSTILDLGAGNGIASWAFAKRGFSVEALEPDSSNFTGYGAIEDLVKDGDLSINIHRSWGESIPLDANSVDVVYCRSVLHHAHDLVETLKEIWRVLKPNGIALITREHIISKDADLSTFLQGHPMQQFSGEECAYTLRKYKTVFRSASFRRFQIIRTYKSVVNYYPLTSMGLLQEIEKCAISRFGMYAGSLLARLSLFQHSYLWMKDYKDNTPGRLYSFVLFKGRF